MKRIKVCWDSGDNDVLLVSDEFAKDFTRSFFAGNQRYEIEDATTHMVFNLSKILKLELGPSEMPVIQEDLDEGRDPGPSAA